MWSKSHNCKCICVCIYISTICIGIKYPQLVVENNILGERKRSRLGSLERTFNSHIISTIFLKTDNSQVNSINHRLLYRFSALLLSFYTKGINSSVKVHKDLLRTSKNTLPHIFIETSIRPHTHWTEICLTLFSLLRTHRISLSLFHVKDK